MFDRNVFKRFCKNRNSNSKITLINFLGHKSQQLKGEITIGHCKGHDCIILFFNFDGFYDN